MERVTATLEYLRARQWFRAGCILLGEPHRVSFTNDPAWLINQAINRRAGWLDDPSSSRGSARPINGRYPKKAEGDRFNHLRLIAHEVNTPRLIVRDASLGEWRKLILSRIPDRIAQPGDDNY